MSSQHWYYLNKGKPVGPIPTSELNQLIASRQLGPFDLVFCEGQSKWKPVIEFDELLEILNEFQKFSDLDEWVVLRPKKEEGKVNFLQEGPYGAEEVKARILRGDLSYRDYIWKKGMREWYLISTLEQFNEKPQAFQIQQPEDMDVSALPIPESDIKSILDSVEVFSRAPQIQERPPEAVGPELTAVDDVEGVLREEKKNQLESSAVEAANRDATKAVGKKTPDLADLLRGSAQKIKKKSPLFYLNFILFGVMISIVALIVQIRRSGQVLTTVEVAQQNSKKASQRRRVKKKSVKKEVAQLPEAKVLKLSKKKSKVFFKTDAHKLKKIRIEVLANGDKLIGPSGYFRSFSVPSTQQEIIDFAKAKMPAGEYLVRGSVDNQESEVYVKFRTRGKKYRQKLYLQKKKISYFHQREKYELVNWVGRVHRHALRLYNEMKAKATSPEVRRRTYRRWVKEYRRMAGQVLPKTSSEQLAKKVYPLYWMELKEFWGQLGWLATSYSQNFAAVDDKLVKQAVNQEKRVEKLKQKVETARLFP